MPIVAGALRLSQETGSADGKMPNSGSGLELWAKDKETLFHANTRRDALANGMAHLHAQALACAGFSSGSHLLAWGLGSHFWQKAQRGKTEPGSFSPAVGFLWQHPQFELMLAGSQHTVRGSLSFLLDLLLPIELNGELLHLTEQPLRTSANAFWFISDGFGLVTGYEPLGGLLRAGLWLKIGSWRCNALWRSHGNASFWEFGVSFSWSDAETANISTKNITTPVSEDRPPEEKPTATKTNTMPPLKLKKQEKIPDFHTLVRWGLSPKEAWQFVREKNPCRLSAKAQAILAQRRWGCHA